MKGMNWTERLSVVSSVASITGVSLVWLQSFVKEASFMTTLFGGVATVVGSLVTLGVLVVAVQVFLALGQVVRRRLPSAIWGYGLFVGAAIIWGVFFSQLLIWSLVREAWTVHFSG